MRSLALATVIACMLGTTAAQAIEPAVLEEAKVLFVAGDKAYSAGNFPAAIRAFQEAYKKAPLPPLLFSIAQAYRREYAIGRKPENLREAIAHYRKYIELVPQGGRRADAAAALAELEVMAAQSAPSDPAAPQSPSPSVEKSPTRVMISASVKEAHAGLRSSELRGEGDAGPDGVRVVHDMDAQVGHGSARKQGDPLRAAVRGAAGLAVTGVKVGGAVTKEILRRLPRP